jgi:hypothetical protein
LVPSTSIRRHPRLSPTDSALGELGPCAGAHQPIIRDYLRPIVFIVVSPVLGMLLALSVGVAGAYFTARVEVADSMIKAGSVVISAEPTSAALSIPSLAPGTSQSRPLTVVNDGSLPVTVVVKAVKKAGITDFYNALTCKVTCDGALLYDGALASLQTTPAPLPAGARTTLQFEVGLPDGSGNDLAGDYAKVSLLVDAEQQH